MALHAPSESDNAGQRGTECEVCGARITARAAGHIAGKRHCESCYLDGCKEDVSAIERAYEGFAEALVAALDAREHETGLHSKRVACHTLVVARRFIAEPARLRQVYWGALLHDVGKIGVPDAVLLNDGPLDEAEWSLMRAHPEAGKRILENLPAFGEAAEIVLCHEERYDGSGYPNGLRGNAIPLGARLFAVIDTLDAMTSDRPYRRGLDFDTAKAEIRRMGGSQFDPLAVQAFLQEELTLRQMVALKCGTAVLPAIASGI
jgi:response regulator RpfG family c-di-GMP phosphodiesterase